MAGTRQWSRFIMTAHFTPFSPPVFQASGDEAVCGSEKGFGVQLSVGAMGKPSTTAKTLNSGMKAMKVLTTSQVHKKAVCKLNKITERIRKIRRPSVASSKRSILNYLNLRETQLLSAINLGSQLVGALLAKEANK